MSAIEKKSLREQVEAALTRKQVKEERTREIYFTRQLEDFGSALSHLVGYPVRPSSIEMTLEGLRFCLKRNTLMLVGNCPECEARQEYAVSIKKDHDAQVGVLAECLEYIKSVCTNCRELQKSDGASKSI